MMNLGFQLANLLGSEVPLAKGMLGNAKNSKAAGLFEGIFQRILNSNSNSFLESPKNLGSAEIPISLSEKSLSPERNGVIEKIKKHFLSKASNPNVMHINKDDLQKIQDTLIYAGFNKEDINRIFTGLQDGAKESSGLKLSDLFSGLTELQNCEETEPAPKIPVFEISALPYIESILSALKVPSEQIKESLSDAKIEGEGINLNQLVNNLKNIVKLKENKGQDIPDEQTQSQVLNMMAHIGMPQNNKEQITLEKFVSRLESLNDAVKKEYQNPNIENVTPFLKDVQLKPAPIMEYRASKHQALMYLKKFLTDSGFDKKDVETFVNNLDAKASSNNLPTTELFTESPELKAPYLEQKPEQTKEQKDNKYKSDNNDIQEIIPIISFIENQIKKANPEVDSADVDTNLPEKKAENQLSELNVQKINIEPLNEILKLMKEALTEDDQKITPPQMQSLKLNESKKEEQAIKPVQVMPDTKNLTEQINNIVPKNKEIERGRLSIETFVSRLQSLVEQKTTLSQDLNIKKEDNIEVPKHQNIQASKSEIRLEKTPVFNNSSDFKDDNKNQDFPKQEFKPDFRPEPKSEPKQEFKPDFRPEPKSEPKSEPKQEFKPDFRSEPKFEPKSEPKFEKTPVFNNSSDFKDDNKNQDFPKQELPKHDFPKQELTRQNIPISKMDIKAENTPIINTVKPEDKGVPVLNSFLKDNFALLKQAIDSSNYIIPAMANKEFNAFVEPMKPQKETKENKKDVAGIGFANFNKHMALKTEMTLETKGISESPRLTTEKKDGEKFSEPKKVKEASKGNNMIFDSILKENRIENVATGAASHTEKPLPSYLLDQVSRQIVKSVQNGEGEISLNVKPPELGRLQMSINNTSEGLKITITTEQTTTKDMLTANIAELKNTLSEQGFKVEQVDIKLSYNFNESMPNPRQDSKKSNKRNNSRFNFDGSKEIESIDNEVPVNNIKRDSMLNLVA
ncbi:MAG: flagellar hook-length control protein FliK [Desulfobacterales bacterium]|nr:flagellar hook-length control protein FliK [Desulfobacterales bacterium]